MWRKIESARLPIEPRALFPLDFQKIEKHLPEFLIPTRETVPILGPPEVEDKMAEWETGWSRDVLERIAALLFSLAGLADIAAGLPALRRRHVLGILNHGEAEARAFLIGISTGAPADAPETAGDAKRLAARLRALALLLCALLM